MPRLLGLQYVPSIARWWWYVVLQLHTTKNSKAMKTLSKQIEESILDGINTYKELAAIGRGFDVSAFSKMCAGQIRREALRDVDKAFDEWMEDPNQTSFIHITPINELWFAKQSVKNFAMYFAQRCGVEVEK